MNILSLFGKAKDNKRTFTVVSVKKSTTKRALTGVGGRFTGKTARSAASKMLSKLCREKKIKGQCTLIITVREITRGGKSDVSVYKGKRVKSPVKVKYGNKTITHNYKNKISKV